MSDSFSISIDGHTIPVSAGQSVLDAARALGIDIPALCYLEACGPLNSCLVCLVKINGKLVPSCGTKVQPGLVVESETDEVHEARRTALELLFSDHVGDCLSPCQRLCPLRLNIPVMLRQIQSGQVDEAIVTVRDAIPLAAVMGRLCHHPCEQGCRRGTWDEAASIRQTERFIADTDLGLVASGLTGDPASVLEAGAKSEPSINPARVPYLPACKSPSGKSVVVVGAGPTGLAAAFYLLRQGHACTIADRNAALGGSLRGSPESALPRAVLEAELNQLERMGARFRPGAVLGQDIRLDGLLRGADAVLLAVGEISKAEGDALGVGMVPGGIKTDPETFLTSREAVFAAGRAVKPLNQLVRAMSEGQAAAECIHRFLMGKKVQRPGKPFSSIMGRLEPEELKLFLRESSPARGVSPCDACSGFSKSEAASEATRCLRCDCRSSGHCALQHYAQVYEADGSRFRAQRRKFDQQVQPGGVIFEPGKCILCGICVKLTERAREPLGLAFIGRGFSVRVAAPFDHSIEEGLKDVAAECVRHCPTGALEFKDQAAPRPTGEDLKPA